MSANRFVRSLGNAYFGFVQNNLDGSSQADYPQKGITKVVLRFALHSLPTQVASTTELHPLFSFNEYGGSGIRVLDLGVTPTGALKASANNGSSCASTSAAVVPDGVVHEAQVNFNPATGSLLLFLDGAPKGSSVSAATPLLPRAAKLGRFALFNGMKAETKCDASIRSCVVTFTDAGGLPHTLSWLVNERVGPYLNAAKSAGAFSTVDARLAAQWYNPLVWPLLFGAIPTTDPGEAYRWGSSTIWTRKVRPRTTWTRVSA